MNRLLFTLTLLVAAALPAGSAENKKAREDAWKCIKAVLAKI